MKYFLSFILLTALPFVTHGRYAENKKYEYETHNAPFEYESYHINTLNDNLKGTVDKEMKDLVTANTGYFFCINSVLNPDDYENSNTIFGDELYRKMCKNLQSSAFKACGSYMRDAYKPYLKERINVLETGFNVVNSAADFACENDAKNFKAFMNSDGPQCVSIVSDKIMRCISRTLDIDFTSSWPQTMANFDQLQQKMKGCETYEELRNCVVRGMQTCFSNTPALTADALMERLEKVVGC